MTVAIMITGVALALLAAHLWKRHKARVPTQGKEVELARRPTPDIDLSPMRDALAPWRARNTRPAWRPLVVSTPHETRSWFGGLPLMEPGEPWPACSQCKHPMHFMLQLDLSTLPNREQLPVREGLLQLFYCSQSSGSCDDWRTFSGAQLPRLVRTTALQPGSSPEGLAMLPQKWIEQWQKLADLPSDEDHGLAGLAIQYDFPADIQTIEAPDFGVRFEKVPLDIDLEEVAGSAAEGDKLAGWPRWIQGNECPECPTCGTRMEFVFQLDSENNLPIMFGDAGIGHITQCPKHPEVLAFGWACS